LLDWLFAKGELTHTWKARAGFSDHVMICCGVPLKRSKEKFKTVWRRNLDKVDLRHGN
jgi:hypothetical protein